MKVLFGIAFLITGLLSFWHTYEVWFDRDYLWVEEVERLQAQGKQPERTAAWDREQKLQSLWWRMGGISSVWFAIWLLA